MKRLTAFLAISCVMILLACRGKGTEPPDDKHKFATINATVVDSMGTGVVNVPVTTVFYFVNTKLLSFHFVDTERYGKCTFDIPVLNIPGYDTVFAYASRTGIPPTSDTVKFVVGPNHPTIGLAFVLPD